MKKLKKFVACLLIIICFWFLLPLAKGIIHIGMIYPVIMLCPIILFLLKPNLWEKGKKYHFILIKITSIIYAVVFLLCGCTLTVMIFAANQKAPANSTCIVLGCMVYGEKPSRMLNDRCEAAYEYMKKNPKASCIATGGQGKREDISEAEAICRILTNKGISGDRIYLEDESTDTYENLQNAAKIIEENHLSKNVAVTTNSFHIYRGEIYAKLSGLTPYAVSAPTYLIMLPGYWAREILAVWEAWIFY